MTTASKAASSRLPDIGRRGALFHAQGYSGQGALLSMSGEKKVAVLVRDLPGMRVEIGRVLPGQLQHLVSQSSGDFAISSSAAERRHSRNWCRPPASSAGRPTPWPAR